MDKRFRHTAQRLREELSFFRRSYRYQAELTSARGARGKLPLLLQSFRKTFIDRKTVLFYPDGPRNFHALFKILMSLGYRYTSDPQRKYDLAIHWWVARDGNPFAPEKSSPLLTSIKQSGATVLNIRCSDISKNRVNSTFEEIFGYSLAVDPRTHSGECVVKANWNALHLGQIIECPTEPPEGDLVYQKLIRNEVEDGLVEDIRVPIFGKKTPFVYLKYRPVSERFVDRPQTNKKANKKAKITEVADVLSANELSNIYRFCESIGMDYGEIDVLRDKGDGRIYIVDANNTPSGPPSTISSTEGKIAVVRLAQAFEEAYGV